MSTKGIKIQPLINNLSRFDARAVEQCLIEHYGLLKNGGTLLNKINSIAQSNPNYAKAVVRGLDIVKNVFSKLF